MKDRETVWKPYKEFVEKLQEYSIFKSAPDEDNGTVQLAIRANQSPDDLMRVDSYKEGYFSAYWDSAITLVEFFNHAESYFRDQESLMTAEKPLTLGIFTAHREPQMFGFDRPLVLSDFTQAGAFVGDNGNPLTVVRLETPIGDLVWEADEKTVGIIVDADIAVSNLTVNAIVKLVHQTQPLLTNAVVSRVLSLLPYSEK